MTDPAGVEDPTSRHPTPAQAPTDPVSPGLLPMTSSVGADGHLSVGGVDLTDLAHRIGTPLFVYDEAHLRSRSSPGRRGVG